MRDRAAERAFLLATLEVDMNPLVIAGNIGEVIDLFLTYLDGLLHGP